MENEKIVNQTQKRLRNWVFTNNKPEEAKYESEITRYCIWQLEKGEGTGHLHHQGYIELTKAVTLNKLKQLFGNHIHWEQRKGTPEQARNYCLKSETKIDGPWEIGTFKGKQGKRTELDIIKEKLDNGYSTKEIAQENFEVWAKYYKCFDRYVTETRTQTHRDKPHVIVITGDPGTGKTRQADQYDPDAFWKNSGKWWDGYTDQETIILDDFYGWLDYDIFLKLLDRYPLTVETKGGHVNLMNRKRIIITSNDGFSKWYPQKDCGAIRRRIDELIILVQGTEVSGNTMPTQSSCTL